MRLNFNYIEFAILAIGLGLLSLNKKFVIGMIRLKNKMDGVKTEISSTTLICTKIGAVISIIFGLVLLFVL